MLQEALGTVYLLLPLLGGAIVHGTFMRQGWLACLARPMDGGRTLGGRPVFGGSKTFRGPVCVAAGAGAVFALQQGPLHGPCAGLELVDYARLPAWLGAGLGAAAELAELPNSFVKRRLGVAPGETARGPLAVVFYLWDQLDLLVGYWLVAAPFVAATPARLSVSIAVVGGIHPLLSLVGYLLGMRTSAR